MQRRRTIIGLAAVLALPLALRAQPADMGSWPMQGDGQMRFFGLLVYDIKLWAPTRVGAQWWTQPLALELTYARSLQGKEIAKRSLEEMRRQQTIDDATGQRWLAEMEAAFPDVKQGDRISGRHDPAVGAVFHVNGKLSRRINDPLFSRLFFGIWLAPQTSEPALRKKLLGLPS
jgi:hypothetical protein